MQIGLRLHDAKQLPLEERLEVVHEQGFKCGHLALSKVINEYSVANSALTPGYAMYLKRLFWKNELDVAVLGCYLNLANPNEESLKQIMKKYEAHIRFASALGVGVVGTETGAPNEEYKYVPESHGEEALETFIRNLRPVVEYAEKMGVIFAIEPVWNHIVWNPKRARQVLDTINSPNLKIILDPVNLLSIHNYEQREEVIKEAIELLGEDVAVVHIKDFIVKDNDLVSVGAGTGMMNYKEILTFIKKEKPYIHVTLENTTPENAVSCKNHIEEIYNSIV
ncbi:MAG: sugar phosphate isomerase/epimerase family protein [bacterium]|nr:sugar phosphate isomerase/epimerase family protein [bacterium]